jgi:homogentisate 1,2-dioxygenase
LTAKSRDLHAPLCDFLIFGPRWDVAQNTFRPPYFHRNCASEFLARIYGPEVAGGRSEVFAPGGASYEAGFTPHGNADQRTIGAMHVDLKPMRVGENQLTFMLESCRSLFTNWALKDSGVLVAEDIPASTWDTVPVC